MNQEQNKILRFLLSDDHSIVRQGLQFTIEDIVDDAEFIHASDLGEVLTCIKSQPIDIAILDAQFPDGNSLSILEEIKSLQPNIKILVFTSFDEETYSLKYINEGADGFLSKTSEEDEIRHGIREMIENGKYLPLLTKKMLQLSDEHLSLLNPLNQLTEREIEIAVLYAKGFGNLEISNTIELKQNTVSTFKKRIFEKLKVTSIIELTDLMRIHHEI